MKQFIYYLFVLLFAIACSSQKGVVKIERNNEERAVTDSVEYVLETFDGKFETWYTLHNNPSQYRSQQYYESWNERYIAAWNYNSSQPDKRWFFEPVIGWYPNVDYGFELNHKLFYYFQYVEHVLNIQIMKGGPRGVIL